MSIRAILILAFLLRVSVPVAALLRSHDPAVFHARDTASYVTPAKELLSTGRFTSGGLPEIIRTPGYPILLIPGIVLGQIELVTILLQIVLSSATVYVVYRIGLLLFGNGAAARLGALLYAIEPLSVLYSSRLLSETLFTALIMVSLYWLLRYLKDRSLRQLMFSAVLFAASVYVRPIGYFLPALITALLLGWFLVRMRAQRTILLHIPLFLAVGMGLVGLWQVRNQVEAGYSGFSAITDTNLYFYPMAAVLAAKEGVPYYDMQKRLGYHNLEVYLEDHPEQLAWSRGRRYEWMRARALGVLRHNPGVYANIHLKGVLRVLLDPGAVEIRRLLRLYPESGGLLGRIVDQGMGRTVLRLIRERPALFWSNLVLGMLLLAFYLLAVAGALKRKSASPLGLAALLAVAAYLILLSGGPNSTSRFRHPVMPIVAVLAGYGLARVGQPGRGKSIASVAAGSAKEAPSPQGGNPSS